MLAACDARRAQSLCRGDVFLSVCFRVWYVMEMSHLFAIATASSLKQEGPSKGKRYFVHEKKCRYELDKIDT